MGEWSLPKITLSITAALEQRSACIQKDLNHILLVPAGRHPRASTVLPSAPLLLTMAQLKSLPMR
ncbi:mCG147403 [Mus musculus]|nr:mCG147403 [Mus musculus]